jgi:hypothetical protein
MEWVKTHVDSLITVITHGDLFLSLSCCIRQLVSPDQLVTLFTAYLQVKRFYAFSFINPKKQVALEI